jgi:Family of unknown function (DUF5678)
MPDEDEMNESENDIKNDEWFKANYIDLMQEHARDWIAVMDQVVIAIASTQSEVEILANKIAGEKEYSVYFIAPTAMVTDAGYAQKQE